MDFHILFQIHSPANSGALFSKRLKFCNFHKLESLFQIFGLHRHAMAISLPGLHKLRSILAFIFFWAMKASFIEEVVLGTHEFTKKCSEKCLTAAIQSQSKTRLLKQW